MSPGHDNFLKSSISMDAADWINASILACLLLLLGGSCATTDEDFDELLNVMLGFEFVDAKVGSKSVLILFGG